MPIFHDPSDSPARDSQDSSWHHRNVSRREAPAAYNNMDDGRQSTLDRVSLIERLKRSQSPSQPEPQNVSIFWDRGNHSWATENERWQDDAPTHDSDPQSQDPSGPRDNRDNRAAGLSIERPRSALHSGDFRQEKDVAQPTPPSILSTSPVAPWHYSFPTAAIPHIRHDADQTSEPEFPFDDEVSHRRALRSRTTSQSSLSSFVLLPPTSPLVHQSNNTDLDWSPRPRSRQSPTRERDNRRHTFSPQSLQTFHVNRTPTSTPSRPLPSVRREGTFPYQAHQPARRSMNTFFSPHSSSTPQSPFLRPRRPSISSESSPVPHAPMVGSYEESILRGRMSTTPSRPLNFVAQIGVLGKGQCKPQLRCPPHVTLPFPAVFYSYNSGNGKISDNQPSPYVGLVDLENHLKPAGEQTEGRRKKKHTRSHHSDNEEPNFGNGHEEATDADRKAAHRKREKTKRRSTSPKSPPGGSYRIPQQGQLQIVIKNPNKTAVKLFLVPYDLSDMEPGQKTFVRQRSYSAGPVIDMPLSSRNNLGTDRPEASLSTSDDPNDRPILRYLIHLHICCPSKGRFFLYKSIRVVFANRVPDGKEKLRNEIQLPEPKYSAYKPSRDTNTTPPTNTTTAASQATAAEKAYHRRSAGYAYPFSSHHHHHHHHRFDEHDFATPSPPGFNSYTEPSPPPPQQQQPIAPIPFQLSRHHRRLETLESRPSSREQMELDGTATARPMSPQAAGQGQQSPAGDGTWDKRDRGSFASASGVGAGLLAQRLRGLGVEGRRDGGDGAGADGGGGGA
ncbi:uncharacterized protein K452DRAFT_292216 [Aplosporella prunicola CBS 121167]|uniref:Atos-like conserved domain-containing protein n=1 Tax=Aplosporella prunicola CBS 121167 TaxID=1176127 RepID=A0A6A6B0G2_9PEZI|nr:uncharacterized protein K452DRAFT_292216 [Aplosporella prunicola CBS 121167]KAF2136704.1 hypothetical protein K452DRAFT_292216 [Aplosporella prunicola CBS 121167]